MLILRAPGHGEDEKRSGGSVFLSLSTSFFSFWCFFPKRDDFGFVDEAREAAATQIVSVSHPTSSRTDVSWCRRETVKQCKFPPRENEFNIGGNVQTSRLINKKVL